MNFLLFVCLLSISATGVLGQTPAPAASPTSAEAQAAQPPLIVTKFWYPKDAPRRLILGMDSIGSVPDGVWVAGILDGKSGTDTLPQGALYHVPIDASRPDPFGDAPMLTFPEAYAPKVVAMPDAIYLLCHTGDKPRKTVIERYDLAAQKWEAHEVPGADQLYAAAGQLYLTLSGVDFEHRESGIARYDPNTGALTLLASSRRRPAHNQFDDRTPYDVRSIFTGPGGKPCAIIDHSGKSYFISEQPGTWAPLTEVGRLMNATTTDDRTLLWGATGYKNAADAAVMIDPSKSGPELCVGAPLPLPEPGPPNAPPAPLPEVPAWAKQPVWPSAPGDGNRGSSYGFRGDDIFAVAARGPSEKGIELIWYRRGNPSPVHIPLSFAMSGETTQALEKIISSGSNTLPMVREPDKTPYALSMSVASQGICFRTILQGFWFLPFADVDDYLKTHPALSSTPSPTAPLPQTASPPPQGPSRHATAPSQP